jgi:hypothetical protein
VNLNNNNNNNMRPSSLIGYSLLIAVTLFASTTTNASLPPYDAEPQLQVEQRAQPSTTFTLQADQVTPVLELTLHSVADSSFNPRTDFPTRPSQVMTAGFGTLDLQECCGGGSWNYQDKPADRTLLLLGAVLFASMLLAAIVHRYDKRRAQHLATH